MPFLKIAALQMPDGLSSVEIFAGLAVFVAVIRYAIYFHGIYKRETRPHLFTWFNWGTMSGIGAYAQFALNGGPSAWVLAVIAAACYLIAFLALFIGEKNITHTDWCAFIGALMAVPLWIVTDSPVAALLMIIMIDGLSYYPTIRKTWDDPWGEPPVSYFWAGMQYFLAIFAVSDATWQTVIYPLFSTTTDWGFAVYALWRRKILSGTIKQIQNQAS